MQMLYSRGSSIHDARPAQIEVASFRALIEKLDADRAPDKEHAPYICGPLNSDGRRCKESVLPTEWTAVDLDRIRPDLLPAVKSWFRRLECALWPTHSSTAAQPRLRAIVHLSRPAARSECLLIGEALTRDLDAEFGEDVKVDASTFKPEQPVFVPPIAVAIEMLGDAALDVDAYLPDVSAILKQASAAPTGHNPVDQVLRGIDLHENLMRLSAAWSSRGMTLTDIRAACTGLLEQARRVRGVRVDQLLGAELDRLILGAVQKFSQPAPNEPLLLNLAQLQACSEHLCWTVKHVLPANSVGVLFGASGTFKSFVALDLLLHVASSMPWLGKRTTTGDVIYLAAEGGVGVLRRILAWHRRHDLDPASCKARFCVFPLQLLRQAATLRKTIEAIGIRPVLIVIDTMSQTFTGDENSSNEVADYLRALRVELANPFGACVLIIHHSGHSTTERPRGSSAIRNNSDFLFAVYRDEKEMLCRMENIHQKYGELLPVVEFDLTVQNIGQDDDGDHITSLVSSHIDSTAGLVQSIQSNAATGRGGNRFKFLQLVRSRTGELESFIRHEFYKLLGQEMSPDSRKKAYQRCRSWAFEQHLVDNLDGRLYSKEPVDNPNGQN